MASTLFFTALILYTGLVVFAWFFAHHMIYQPPPSSYTDENNIIKLTSGASTKISATYLPNPDALYTILYSHGNAVDLGQLYPILQKIRNIGFSVFAYDYRGYGTSQGRPSEENVYKDIYAAYAYLTTEKGIPADRIIALGQSLGGGAATDLARREPIGGLILESSFITAYRVLTRFPLVPFDEFRNINKIKKVSCPVLVIHGKQDNVIPFWHGKKLFEAANEPKQSFWVEDAGHNNLLKTAGTRYEQTLRKFVKLVENQ